MEITETFVRNLKTVMSEMKISQNRLAQKAGISQSAVSSIVNTTKAPSLDTVSKISSALGVPISCLVGEKEISIYGSEEERLIVIFRQLNAQGKAAVIANAETCLGLSALREEGLTASMA